MSPEEYQKQIKTQLIDLLSADYSMQNDIKYITKALKTEAFGMEFDRWGNVKSGSDGLFFQQIMNDNKDILEEYKSTMREQINTQMKKQTVKINAKRVNNMLESILYEELSIEFKSIRGQIKALAQKQLREELKPWFALNNLMDAAKG